jgi:SNF2 family DNA or RNA helicase
MINLKVVTGQGKLQVFAPFALADYLKELPARRWNKKERCNEYPATVGAARNLYELVHNTNLLIEGRPQVVQATGDQGFHTLLKMMRLQDEAQKIKAHTCTADCPNWHHQGQALSFIQSQPAAMLAMKMGTGKTKVAVDAICARGHKLVLVLTRKKAIPVWPAQIKRFATKYLHVARLDAGSVNAKLNQAQNAVEWGKAFNQPVVLVMNYESAWRDPFAGWALQAGFDLLVMDESHKIKAPGGKASKFCQQMALRVPCKLPLTGTPMGDKPIDLYGQFRALDAAVFGTSFTKFREKYCIMGGYLGKEILGYQNQDEMMQRAGRYMYFAGDEVLKLLPARHKTYYCQLSPDARKVYDRLADDAFAAIVEDAEDGLKNTKATITASNILVKLLRLQQITGGFVTTDTVDENKSTDTRLQYVVEQVDTAKAELLKSVIEDLPDTEGIAPGTPVVVYCKFTQDLRNIKMVAEQLGLSYGEISGQRDDQELFKAGNAQVLGCQIQAGGTGVDGLQDVSHVAIYYSTGYSLTDYEQSLKRLDRPGQTESVLNIHLVAEDTIDEDVITALQEKKDVIKALEEKAKQPQDVVV